MVLQTTKLDEIFTPQSMRRYEDVLNNRKRLVHYTSAEAAMSIVSSKSIWLRNTRFMNDFTEVDHALDLISSYFNKANSICAPFWSAIDRVTAGSANRIRDHFDGWSVDIANATYVCCVSEHRDHEDELGRLSMWRAYGKPNGVAIVVNPVYLALQNDALGAFSYPVEYCDNARANVLFEEVVANVLSQENFLATNPSDDVLSHAQNCFLTFALSIKHPGFEEEKEWRVIYRPNERPSPLLLGEMKSIAGVPQKIFILPLENSVEHNVSGITPAEIVDRIIIGPSDHGFAMRQGFVEALKNAGVPDAEKKVFCSNIPVR